MTFSEGAQGIRRIGVTIIDERASKYLKTEENLVNKDTNLVMGSESDKSEELKWAPLNPMAFCPQFQHITEKIFKKSEKKSLKNCRQVAKSWQNCIDNQNVLWNKIVDDEKNANIAFAKACKIGHSKIAEMLVLKSTDLKINLNKKDKHRNTGFHFACKNDNLEIVNMLIGNSNKFNIDLNAKDYWGKTAYHLACSWGNLNIVEMLIQKSTEFQIDLNAKCEWKKTGFHEACDNGHVITAELIIEKSIEFQIDLNAEDKQGRTALHIACKK